MRLWGRIKMRVVYRQKMDKKTRNIFLADLVGYKIQRDMEASRKLQKLSEDKGFLAKVVNTASKSSSSAGMTIDMVLQGIKTALDMEIFCFKVNGIDVFSILNDKLKDDMFELEIYMNDLYFSSEIALRQAITPGFRKNVTEEYINQRMEKAKKAWLFNFEKNIKEYIDIMNCEKKILEA
jgi:hypothetical protein